MGVEMKTILKLLFFIVLISTITFSQSKDGLKVTNPQKIEYLIADISPDGKSIGLTKERLSSKLELSMRIAKIKPIKLEKGIDGCLYVNINVVGRAFSITLEYHRFVIYYYGDKKKYEESSYRCIYLVKWNNGNAWRFFRVYRNINAIIT
jgi:hypothetical protein